MKSPTRRFGSASEATRSPERPLFAKRSATPFQAARQLRAPHSAAARSSPHVEPPSSESRALARNDDKTLRAPERSAPKETAQPMLVAAGVAIGAYWGWKGAAIGALAGAGLRWGANWYSARNRRLAFEDALRTILTHVGYVAVADVKARFTAMLAGQRDQLIEQVYQAPTSIRRAYQLYRGVRGGLANHNPDANALVALFRNQVAANTLVHQWGTTGTTDPRAGVNGASTFLVHAFTPFAFMQPVPLALGAYVDGALIAPHGTQAVRTCINYLEHPQHPGGNYCLSTSLIDTHHRRTIGPVGLIFNAPAWNYLLVGPRDLNIRNGDLAAWTRERLNQGQTAPQQISANGRQTSLEALEAYTPAQLLAATVHNYNEIGLIGDQSMFGSTPDVTGIFVIVKNGNLCEDGAYMAQGDIDAIDPDGGSENHRLMRQASYYRNIGMLGATSMIERIRQCCANHNLPIVAIDDNHTNLAESGVQLAQLVGPGGAWEHLTVHNF